MWEDTIHKKKMNATAAKMIDEILSDGRTYSVKEVYDILLDRYQARGLKTYTLPTTNKVGTYLRVNHTKVNQVGRTAVKFKQKENKDDEVQKAKMPLKFYTDLIDEIMGEHPQKPLTTRQVSDIMHYKFQKRRNDRRYADGSRARPMSGRYFPDVRQIRRYLMRHYVPVRTGVASHNLLWDGTRR